MEVKVLENVCIGCGACCNFVPEVFDFNDDGFAIVKENAKINENESDIKEASDACPVSAIDIKE